MDLELIDLDWIQTIKTDEIELKQNTYIKVNFFFIKDNSLIRKTNFVQHLLIPNKISKEELIQLIKENNNFNGINFKFVELNYINFCHDFEDLKFCLKNGFNIEINKINIVDDIYLQDSITMFQDLNEINIIFHLKISNCKNTKKIYLENKKKTKKRKII